MTLTEMKVFSKNQKLTTIIIYRSYSHFSNEVFMADVQDRISQVTSENNNHEFDLLKAALNKVIQRHTPMFMQIKFLS